MFPGKSPERFRGSKRHYHRAGSKTPATWDDWIEGGPAKGPRPPRRRGRQALILLAVLALLGLVVGLLIELWPA